jgi:hypothetical protein
MRHTTRLLAITLLGAVACTTGKPGDDTDVDTDNLDDTDVVDTDVLDTDVVDTDVVDTDDTDPGDTDVLDTDPGDTDTGVLDTDTKDTDTGVLDTDVADTDVSDTDGALVPDIVADTLYVNCMPSIPPDPLGGGFDVHYVNDGAAASRAVIQSSALTVNRAPLSPSVWTFNVTPAGSGSVSAGQQRDVTHDKVYGSGVGSPNDLCTLCGGTWSLEVTWLIDGVTVTDSWDAGTVDCVY